MNVTNSAAWNPRDGAGGLVYDGKMWMLGGWNPSLLPKKCDNEVWNSTDGANWTLVKPNTFTESYDPDTDWEGRHTAGYAVYDDKMWIIGGDPLQGHYQSDVWNSTDGVTWTHVNEGSEVPWGPRALHHTLVFDNKIWVMGGQTMPQFAPAEEAFYNDIWTTTDGINWTKVETEGPMWSPRGQIGNNVVFNGRMWILGGGTYDTPDQPARNFYDDVWSSADGIHWEKHLDHAPWYPRQYHEVAVFDGKMWVMEGWNGGNRNDVWYSEDGVNWHEVPNTPWAPRHAATVYTYDDALWMVAGNNMGRDVWKLVRSDTPPDPLKPGMIDFEDAVYVPGNSVIGVDGWDEAIWTADATITDTTVLEGTKSLRLTGSPHGLVQRNFGDGEGVDEGYIVSVRMMADGPATSNAEFHYSHNQEGLATPAGIIAKVGGNFWVFGLQDGQIVSGEGIDSGVPFLSNVEYLLEMEMNFADQTFKSYITDVTNGGDRTFLTEADFWLGAGSTPLVPANGANAGYIAVTRGGAVAYYDDFSCAPAEAALPGDLNADGMVGSADLDIVRANWGQSASSPAEGDPSGDGVVGSADLDIIRANWGATAASAVPEPAVGVLVGWLAFVVAYRSTKKCS